LALRQFDGRWQNALYILTVNSGATLRNLATGTEALARSVAIEPVEPARTLRVGKDRLVLEVDADMDDGVLLGSPEAEARRTAALSAAEPAVWRLALSSDGKALEGTLTDGAGKSEQRLALADAPAPSVSLVDADSDLIEFSPDAAGRYLVERVNGAIVQDRVRLLSWDRTGCELRDGSGVVPLNNDARTRDTLQDLQRLIKRHAPSTVFEDIEERHFARRPKKNFKAMARMLLASSGRHNFDPLALPGLEGGLFPDGRGVPALTPEEVAAALGGCCAGDARLVLSEGAVLAMLARENELRLSSAVQHLLDAKGASSGEDV